MHKQRKRFQGDERAAVTVDWVVLAGAVVALGAGMIASLEGLLEEKGTMIGTNASQVLTSGTDVDNDGGDGGTTVGDIDPTATPDG